MNSELKISATEALQKLKDSGKEFIPLFSRGSLAVEVYRPDKTDKQQPHDKDEVYVIISGEGNFYCEGRSVSFKQGDFLFVPARAEHRFISFTEDLLAWVIFYGPQGGEQ
ncbi:MAG TPA: cupin domain-containing protein [Puia sp.]|nr:cupin domain-containing protein [Puia sp.]